jgi:hypothetical protein
MKKKIVLIYYITTFLIVNALIAQDFTKGKLLVELKIQGLKKPKLLSDLGLDIQFTDTTRYTYEQFIHYFEIDSADLTNTNLPYISTKSTDKVLIEGREYYELKNNREAIVTPYLKSNHRYDFAYVHSPIYFHNGYLSLSTIFSGTVRAEVTMKKEATDTENIRITLSFFQNDKVISYLTYMVPKKIIPRKIRKILPEVNTIFRFD